MAYISFEPKDYFNTTLYTGNATGRTISGVGFQPDWSWIKNRDDTSGHRVLDAPRGGTKELIANGTNTTITDAQSLQSWNSDGFVLGTAAGVNANTVPFVAWNWKANGAGASNTAGSINTIKTSVSTESGFSISTFTGTGSNATVGHGLGVAPKMVIIKSMTGGEDWTIFHEAGGGGKYIILNSTALFGTNVGAFNNTAPTSSVFSVGTFGATNGSSQTLVAYCFADVQGYSKIGSYVGNGNADGAFQYLGFKPNWVLIKRSNASGDQWQLSDGKRGVNGAIKTLYPDSAEAETSSDSIDFLSNGFKNRATSVGRNGSGDTYIYMAFAESPFVSSSGVPATAR